MATYNAGVRNDGGRSRITNEGDAGLPSVDIAGRVGVSDLGKPLGVDPNKGQREPVPVTFADDVLREVLLSLESRGFVVSHPIGTEAAPRAAGTRGLPITTAAGVLYVLGGHPGTKPREFSFTTSNSNATLIAAVSGYRIVATKASAVVDNDCTVSVACRIGFAQSALASTSTSGVDGIILTHPDIAKGSGVIEGNGGAIIGSGGPGEALLITSDTPSGGSLRVLILWHLEPV